MSARTHVTHLILRLDTGGAEKSLYRLLRAERDNLTHHVVCLGKPTAVGKDIASLGVPIEFLDFPSSGPMAVWRAWRILRHTPPDILQGWMYMGNLLASLLALVLPRRVRVAWNVRSSPTDLQQEKKRVRWVIKCSSWFKPDLLIYNSYAGARTHAQLGFKAQQQVVIANGIDLQEFDLGAEPKKSLALRTEHAVGDAPWIGMLTRFHAAKGVNIFLQAAAMLLQQGKRVRFFLAGPGMQADNAELAALLTRAGLTDKVDLLGAQEQPNVLYGAIDILVVASLREGTPNVLLEAQACGVFTIATDVGDVARIIGSQTRLVVPGNVQDLSAKLAKGLSAIESNDQSRRVEQERRMLAQHYDSQACVSAYVDVYEALVARGE